MLSEGNDARVNGREGKSVTPPEVLSLVDASQARIEIDHDDWSELNVLWDSLNQAIVEFHAEHQRCGELLGMNEHDHLEPWCE
jgi:hypothetical protein